MKPFYFGIHFHGEKTDDFTSNIQNFTLISTKRNYSSKAKITNNTF